MDFKDLAALIGALLGTVGTLGSILMFFHGRASREAANAAAETANQAAQSAKSANEAMQISMGELRRDLDQERSERKAETSRYVVERDLLAGKLESVSQEAAQLRQQALQAQRDYQTLKQAHEDAVVQAQSLIKQIEDKGQQIQALEQKLSQVQYDHEVYRDSAVRDRAQLRDAYNDLKLQYDKLAESRTQLEAQIKNQGELHDRELTKLNDATKAQLDEINRRYNSLSEELESAKRAMNDTQGKLENARHFLQKLGIPDGDIDRIFANQATLEEVRWPVLKKLVEGLSTDELLNAIPKGEQPDAGKLQPGTDPQ